MDVLECVGSLEKKDSKETNSRRWFSPSPVWAAVASLDQSNSKTWVSERFHCLSIVMILDGRHARFPTYIIAAVCFSIF